MCVILTMAVTYLCERHPEDLRGIRNAHLFCGVPTYEEALEEVFKGRNPIAVYEGRDSECYGLLVFGDGTAYRLYGTDLGVWAEEAHNPSLPFTTLTELMKEASLLYGGSYSIALEGENLVFDDFKGRGTLTLSVSNLTEEELEIVTHPMGFDYLWEHLDFFCGWRESFKDYVIRGCLGGCKVG